MKKEYYFRIKCSQKECNETGLYTATTQRELSESRQRNKTWTCVRHSQPEEVLSITNLKTEIKLFCTEKQYSMEVINFWKKEINLKTDKLESGFQYGNGYKTFAQDFPKGTVLKVTAEIILPTIE